MARNLLVVCLMALAGILLLGLAVQAEGQEGGAAAKEQEGPNMIEGTVSSVDWGANKLSIGGVAGFLGTELRVTPETKITTRDKEPLTLKEIREGDVIRARYRRVGDQNMATSIAVLYAPGRVPSAGEGGAGEAEQGAKGTK
jgi:hypothetical protein